MNKVKENKDRKYENKKEDDSKGQKSLVRADKFRILRCHKFCCWDGLSPTEKN